MCSTCTVLSLSTGEWLAAGALALVLAAAHFFAYRVSRLSTKTQDVLASVGGGAAIAYIFVHLMPELAVGGRDLTELDVAQYTPTPITEAGLFLTAMVGLVAFFVLDVRTEEGLASTRRSYRIHMLSFASNQRHLRLYAAIHHQHWVGLRDLVHGRHWCASAPR